MTTRRFKCLFLCSVWTQRPGRAITCDTQILTQDLEVIHDEGLNIIGAHLCIREVCRRITNRPCELRLRHAYRDSALALGQALDHLFEYKTQSHLLEEKFTSKCLVGN